MKSLLTVLCMAALFTPTFASEPFSGFADRLVLACSGTGVVDVFFSAEGTLKSYKHVRGGDKEDMESCLTTAYREIASAPTPSNAPSSAPHVTVLRDGTIKLY